MLKSWLERRAPSLTGLYRLARDEWRVRHARAAPTPYGFTFVGDAGMEPGVFEVAEMFVVGARLAQIDVFVDVGANAGYYTAFARQAGKRVIAIEPLAQNLELLYRTLDANGWSDVEVWPVALGEHAGTVDLFGGGTGASLIAGWSGGSRLYRRRVPITRLDTILGDRFDGQRLFIKLDVEGAEAGVLAGAQRVLRMEPRPTWLVESTIEQHHPGGNHRFAEVFGTFWDAGYTVSAADTTGRMVTPDDVSDWVRRGRVPGGAYNWIFEDATHARVAREALQATSV